MCVHTNIVLVADTYAMLHILHYNHSSYSISLAIAHVSVHVYAFMLYHATRVCPCSSLLLS
jgi:hypothetical protein